MNSAVYDEWIAAKRQAVYDEWIAAKPQLVRKHVAVLKRISDVAKTSGNDLSIFKGLSKSRQYVKLLRKYYAITSKTTTHLMDQNYIPADDEAQIAIEKLENILWQQERLIDDLQVLLTSTARRRLDFDNL